MDWIHTIIFYLGIFAAAVLFLAALVVVFVDLLIWHDANKEKKYEVAENFQQPVCEIL